MAAAADCLEEKIMSELASPYAFGDTPVARDRLELLGVVFDPPSRAFLARSVPLPPALAADLGCGPGATTRMVHEATGAHRTMGLDRSPEFVAAARERAVDGIDYHLWEAFREYLAMATALVRAGGSEMFAGPLLARLRLCGQCEVDDDRVVSLPVSPAVAARMFYLNLTVWGGAPWVTANYGPKTVARVGEDLLRISAGSAAADNLPPRHRLRPWVLTVT
jgi:SAM-dependent methyltransferase